MEIHSAPRETVEPPPGWFTGKVRLSPVPCAPAPSRLTAFHVEFEAGGRTAWHRHPRGQVIHVLDGTGLVQRRGGKIETIEAGDTVWTEPGEWHWHGASPGSAMSHLTWQETDEDGNAAYWGEQVEDYPER